MHRARRFQPGVYHLTVQGKERYTIFLKCEDKEQYIRLIYRYKDAVGISVYAYLVLDNTAHILVEEKKSGQISDLMKRLGTGYSQYLRKKYVLGSGSIYRDRYKAERIQGKKALWQEIFLLQTEEQGGVYHYRPFSSYREYFRLKPALDILPLLREFPVLQPRIRQGELSLLMEPSAAYLFTDEEVKEMIDFLLQDKEVKKDPLVQVIQELRKDPRISLRQLSRVLGISKSQVERLQKQGRGKKKPKENSGGLS